MDYKQQIPYVYFFRITLEAIGKIWKENVTRHAEIPFVGVTISDL